MQFVALVMDDKVIEREASGNFKASKSRQLLCVDQDQNPLMHMVTVSIPVDDPQAPAGKGADLRGQVVRLGVNECQQYEGGNSRHMWKGHIVAIEGLFKVEPVKKAA